MTTKEASVETHETTDEQELVESEDQGTQETESQEEQSPAVDPEAIASAMAAVLEEREQKLLDAQERRMDKFVNTLIRDYGLKKQGTSTDSDGKQPQTTGIAGQRVLRVAIRDAVANEFPEGDERKLAFGLAKQIADARGLADSEDEDEVAAEIVEGVKATLGGAKEQYEAALRADLKRRGLLSADAPDQPTGGSGGKQGPTALESFKAGADRAKARFVKEG